MTQDLRDAVRLLWRSPHLSVGIARIQPANVLTFEVNLPN
jgi:hypothetical protein